MNVVYHTGILGQINNAISDANQHISHIEVTEQEMKDLIKDPSFKQVQSKYYGSGETSIPTSIDTVRGSEVPRWMWYRGIKIIVK